jgi:hypothetical protein
MNFAELCVDENDALYSVIATWTRVHRNAVVVLRTMMLSRMKRLQASDRAWHGK